MEAIAGTILENEVAKDRARKLLEDIDWHCAWGKAAKIRLQIDEGRTTTGSKDFENSH